MPSTRLLPQLHRLPRHDHRGWQIGRTGLQLMPTPTGRWRVTTISTAHTNEDDWLIKHKLGGYYDLQVTWPTRKQALRSVAAHLAVDPLPEYEPPPKPRKIGENAWIGPDELIVATRVREGWQLRAVNPDHDGLLPIGPHTGFRTLASLYRLLESAEIALRVKLAHDEGVRCEDEGCRVCLELFGLGD